MEVTMTLYEALEKKKILESKIDSISYRIPRLVDTKKTYGDTNIDGTPISEIERSIQAGKDAYYALVINLRELKAAINDANATIKIEVAGKTYSIANAIARLRSLADEIQMYNKMAKDIKDVQVLLNKQSQALESDAIAAYINKMLGDSKKDENIIKSIKESYIRDNTYELYDPFNTRELAEEGLLNCEAFRQQIHFALTKANCENYITVNFID